MFSSALIPWLDPETIITGFGPFALLGVCLIVFAETGLLIGFLLPGDTLLVITGVFVATGVIDIDIWWVALAIGFAAFLGGEVGYFIGHKAGPRIFERKESGLFSVENVKRTNAFFERFGGLAVIVARFVPVVRTFAPIAAGVGHMNYKKYSLYNLVGAIAWGIGVTMLGFGVGQIPTLRDFVTSYIDIILLAAVAVTLVPTVYHYVQSMVKARRARNAGPVADANTDTGALVLDESLFDQDKSNDPKN